MGRKVAGQLAGRIICLHVQHSDVMDNICVRLLSVLMQI